MALMSKESIIPSNGSVHNTVTTGTKIVGKITSDSDFRLDGEIEGDIICKGKVVIGAKGFVKGSITCSNAEVTGKVKGNLQVSDTLTLRSTAIIDGDVITKLLVVESNAVFNGACSMKDDTDSKSKFTTQEKP